MGEELTAVLEKLSKGQKVASKGAQYMNVGVDTLPAFPKDNTDRNRTSPFAFTGNKFEFRMVGSSQSIAGANVALNTIAAEALDEIATRLEKAKDKNAEAAAIIKETYKKHGRILFNGNNYSEEWVKEAEKRGLANVTNSVDALKALVTEKALSLLKNTRSCPIRNCIPAMRFTSRPTRNRSTSKPWRQSTWPRSSSSLQPSSMRRSWPTRFPVSRPHRWRPLSRKTS